MYRPLLMHRTRGLKGPLFCKVANLTNHLAHGSGTQVGLDIVPSPPSWAALPDVNVSQGGAWTQDLHNFTSGTDPMIFTLEAGNLPTGITLNLNGTFSGTVTNLAGAGTAVYLATNSAGATVSGNQAWTIP